MSFTDRPRDTLARRLLFQVHLWVGLIIGPVVAVVTLTGSIVVFRYELNRLTTPGTAYVVPGTKRLTIDQLMERIHAAYPGDTIAIVGPTGAGKTTLVNLLMRFYEIQGGKITVDGVDVRDMERGDLRQLFGMVLQAGISLTSLKLGILMALLFFTGPVVTHALAQTCLHEKIEPLLADRPGTAD